MKGGKNMRKKLIAAMMAGVLSAGMFSTGVFAADTDLKGEVNTFIAASLSNAMEEIQKSRSWLLLEQQLEWKKTYARRLHTT